MELRLGQAEMASRFRLALGEEEEHLANVRRWIKHSLEGQVGLEQEAVIGQ